MVDTRQTFQNPAQSPIGHGEGIAAGDQNLGDGRMGRSPVQGAVDNRFGGHCSGSHGTFDFPVSLTIDADLRAGVERFENDDGWISAGDQVDGRGVGFAHEVKGFGFVAGVLGQAIHVGHGRNDLGSGFRSLPPSGRCP